MQYVYFDLYDLDRFSYTYAYSMFDDIVSASNNVPQFGQIWPR
ncbi:hypothetical protein U2063_15405 [Listeria monocytogenes]